MILMLPAALLAFQAPAIPRATEVRPGIFVLQGLPDAETFSAMKAAGVTQVVTLRKAAEGDTTLDALAAKAAAADFAQCPMDREPKPEDLDAFRARLKALPKGARVLLHCASGNRVGGALYTYWVLNEGMEPLQALELAKKAGLANPVTEAAVKAYVAARKQVPSPDKPVR